MYRTIVTRVYSVTIVHHLLTMKHWENKQFTPVSKAGAYINNIHPNTQKQNQISDKRQVIIKLPLSLHP